MRVVVLALVTSVALPAASDPWLRELAQSPRLLGDPAGARGRLEDLGIGFQLFYQQLLAVKPAGGGARHDTTFGHSASYDWFTRIDADALVGWPGLELLLHTKGQYDDNLNEDVGALSSPIDDADFDEGIYVDELWLQQSLFDNRLRVRAGLLEQQTVFDRNAFANSEDRQFLATFLDNDGVVPLPNGLGVTLMVEPVRGVELALGVIDADNVPRHAGFDTFFDSVDSLTGTFELTWRARLVSARGPLPGSYRVGMFVDGRRLMDLDRPPNAPDRSRGHLGAYLSVDQLVFREREASDQGLGVFARFGYADAEVNTVAWFWSVGGQYRGPLPGRDGDVVGVGVYQAIASPDAADTAPGFDHETGVEVYYQVEVFPWLTLTPDFQYIFDPGTRPHPDAAIVALRFRVTL